MMFVGGSCTSLWGVRTESRLPQSPCGDSSLREGAKWRYVRLAPFIDIVTACCYIVVKGALIFALAKGEICMEKRLTAITVETVGGNSGKHGKTYKSYQVALPAAWVKALGVAENGRLVELTFDGERIMIAPPQASAESVKPEKTGSQDVLDLLPKWLKKWLDSLGGDEYWLQKVLIVIGILAILILAPMALLTLLV